MWTEGARDRWEHRSAAKRNGNGFLMRRGNTIVEAHISDGRATVHTYVEGVDPAVSKLLRGMKPEAVGSPLDGYMCISTRELTELVDATPAQVWEILAALDRPGRL